MFVSQVDWDEIRPLPAQGDLLKVHYGFNKNVGVLRLFPGGYLLSLSCNWLSDSGVRHHPEPGAECVPGSDGWCCAPVIWCW